MEAEFWDPARGGGIFLHHYNAIHNCKDKPYPYVKTGKAEENHGEYWCWKGNEIEKENPDPHKMK